MRERVKKEFFAEISTKELLEELKKRVGEVSKETINKFFNQNYIGQQIEKDTTRHK
ncbi:hypothetical protein BX659_13143 [Orenia metallireducens]|jgi:hypothetical protein|uniref:Uncharacterized protein n=1 Tax=Orenia metallireducens TaxID=1413210 RepID=A0A285I951_9FIRM|nr:hypothetical protein [Orenia metallireducens]PRX21701.1 hypothetical protein BX659_13143 [Orenia metallireducens]SNY44510.1 hypothetical protein SAMN06265827_13443 [Orenia metallireducens]